LTFDKVIVDAASAFTFGQVYVALSRCRTLEGLVLASPISASCKFDNEDVLNFNNAIPSAEQVESELDVSQSSYYYDLLFELFDVSAIYRSADRLNGFFQSHLRRLYPDKAQKMNSLLNDGIVPLIQVSEKFHRQLSNIRMQCSGTPDSVLLQERVSKGVEYFDNQLEQILLTVAPILEVEVKSKTVASDFKELSADLRDALGMRQRCLKRVGAKGFSPEVYNQAKVDFLLDKDGVKPSRRGSKSIRKERAKTSTPKTKKWDFEPQIPQTVKPTKSPKPPKEPKPPKQPKEPKTPSWLDSARMRSEGMSIEAIAAQRGLTVSTVSSHLISALAAGAITIDTLVTSAEFDDIVGYLIEENPQSLKEMYEHFNGRYEYYQLRAVLMESKDLIP
jgi:hypothetical protein